MTTTTKDDEPQRSEVHVYDDGSSVVGVPPFPEKSPIERAAEALANEPALKGDVPLNTVTADNVVQAKKKK
jgi:hypothetical protein